MEQIEELRPNAALQEKIEMWRQKKAAFTATAVGMYIAAVAVLCALPGFAALKVDWDSLSDYYSEGLNVGRYGLMGFIIFLGIVAVATGLLVYVNMAMPADVAPYLGKKVSVTAADIKGDTVLARLARTYLSIHSPICLIIYFLVSFGTHDWHITWIIFLIDVALVKAVKSFCGVPDDEE